MRTPDAASSGRTGPSGRRTASPGDPRAPRRLPSPATARGDAFWQAGVDAGLPRRRRAGAAHAVTARLLTTAGLLLDPDGETASRRSHGDREDAVPDGAVDARCGSRVRAAAACRSANDTTIAPHAQVDPPGGARARPGAGPARRASRASAAAERPLTEHVLPRFPRAQDAAMGAVPAAARGARCYERPRRAGRARRSYHPRPTAPFVLRPGGAQHRGRNPNRRRAVAEDRPVHRRRRAPAAAWSASRRPTATRGRPAGRALAFDFPSRKSTWRAPTSTASPDLGTSLSGR